MQHVLSCLSNIWREHRKFLHGDPHSCYQPCFSSSCWVKPLNATCPQQTHTVRGLLVKQCQSCFRQNYPLKESDKHLCYQSDGNTTPDKHFLFSSFHN